MAEPGIELAAPTGLHALDVVILVIILLGSLQGVRRGLSGELSHVVSAIAMVAVGWIYLTPLSRAIADVTRLSTNSARPVAFVLAALLVLIAMLILRGLLKHVMEINFNKHFDRWAGLVAGALKTTAIIAAALFVCMLAPSDYLNRVVGEESLIGRQLHRFLPAVRDQIEGRNDDRDASDPDDS